MEAAGEYPAEINMGLTEILLILLGILAFVGSFVIPENLLKDKDIEVKIPEEEIKELVQNEVKQAAFQIEEKTDETMSAAAEKTERYMERLSNEKIMAIQEYSDTVLSQINKNHEEAVFLYDMLNNKHAQVKNTAAELNSKVQDAKADIEQTIQVQLSELPLENVESVKASVDNEVEVDLKNDNVVSSTGEKEEKTVAKRPAAKRKAPAKKTPVKRKSSSEKAQEIEIQFEPDSDIGSNKSKILELHKDGKSNMAIAKSLGLGIGEVKLIIDLFESGE